MGRRGRFATGRSAKNYFGWFKGNENWNQGKVTTYTEEEYKKIKKEEEEERKNKKK